MFFPSPCSAEGAQNEEEWGLQCKTQMSDMEGNDAKHTFLRLGKDGDLWQPYPCNIWPGGNLKEPYPRKKTCRFCGDVLDFITKQHKDLQKVQIGSRGTGLVLLADGAVKIFGKSVYTFDLSALSGRFFRDIAVGRYHMAAVTIEGSVLFGGDNMDGACDMPAYGVEAVSVACGMKHTAVLFKAHTLRIVGKNAHGQCDLPQGFTFQKILAYDRNTVALSGDGRAVVTMGHRAHITWCEKPVYDIANFGGETWMKDDDGWFLTTAKKRMPAYFETLVSKPFQLTCDQGKVSCFSLAGEKVFSTVVELPASVSSLRELFHSTNMQCTDVFLEGTKLRSSDVVQEDKLEHCILRCSCKPVKEVVEGVDLKGHTQTYSGRDVNDWYAVQWYATQYYAVQQYAVYNVEV